MPKIPSLDDVKAYLGTDHSWSDSEIQSALDAQAGDQAKKCKVPATRSLSVTTTNGNTTVTGSFLATDATSYITGTGIPAGATIVSVATDLLSAVISAAPAASGTVTATLEAPWPWALVDALKRRCHVALSLKPLPLGVQVTLSDVNAAQTRVGSPSADALVRDLELPYRKRTLR